MYFVSDEQNFSVWGFIKGFGKLLIGFLLLLQGLVGLVVLLMIVSFAVGVSSGFSGGDAAAVVSVPEEAALVINPNGVLVEQAETVDPFEAAIQDAYGVDEPTEVEVHDLVRAIRNAKTDDRIKGLVLDLGNLYISGSSASKGHLVAAEVAAFREAGKPVYAIGDYYDQEQYLIASQASKIYLHDRGNLLLTGYGSYGTFLKSFLDKLLITPHVFRVGTFKAAVEPFLRDDMSPEAKEANLAYLSVIWDNYGRVVEEARRLPRGAVAQIADDFNEVLRSAKGDFAEAALQANLVDELKSRPEQLAALKEIFGEGGEGESFKQVGFRNYLTAVGGDEDGDAPNIAIVTAAGTIVDGEAPDGVAAGGDTVAGYLKAAREDDDVKAVVLRVDSPGGSAFASEIIRDQVIALKDAGKPVVVSMGSLAASGGYWISAPADEIWAAPTTITGSIGIFGFFMTFEEAAKEWGVKVDGVGTSTLSSLYGTGLGPLEERAADIFQQSIENGYEDFLAVVSEGRELDRDYVDSIGQGRVWIGETAKEIKLADKLGTLDDAVAAAAKLANLEEYDRVEMMESASPFDRFLSNLAAETMARVGVSQKRALASKSVTSKLIGKVEDQLEFIAEFNDPQATYARCLACE